LSGCGAFAFVVSQAFAFSSARFMSGFTFVLLLAGEAILLLLLPFGRLMLVGKPFLLSSIIDFELGGSGIGVVFQEAGGSNLISFCIIFSTFQRSHAFIPASRNSFKNQGSLFCTSIGFILSPRRVLNRDDASIRAGSENACLITGNSIIKSATFCNLVDGICLHL